MEASDLERHKRDLLALRARLTGEVGRMIDAVHENVQASGNLSHLPIHLADQAMEGVDTEVDLLHNEQEILEAVEQALERIENGAYGRCVECGTEIAEARLDAIPYTPYCINCASRLQSPPAT